MVREAEIESANTRPSIWRLCLFAYSRKNLESAGGIQPPLNGFADHRLSTWPRTHGGLPRIRTGKNDTEFRSAALPDFASSPQNKSPDFSGLLNLWTPKASRLYATVQKRGACSQ